MAIEKGMFAPPEGEEIEESLEISVVEPEMVTMSDGSMEITLVPESGLPMDLAGAPFDANIAEYMEDTALEALSGELIGYVESDVNSRKDWADTFVKGLEVLGFKYEQRDEPWEDACGVFSTVLAEAAIRFQAEAMAETQRIINTAAARRIVTPSPSAEPNIAIALVT